MLVVAVTPVILIADTEVAEKHRKAVKAPTVRGLEIMEGGINTGFLLMDLMYFSWCLSAFNLLDDVD
jgi:hypothetical protein